MRRPNISWCIGATRAVGQSDPGIAAVTALILDWGAREIYLTDR
jgi:hypothetical protein